MDQAGLIVEIEDILITRLEPAYWICSCRRDVFGRSRTRFQVYFAALQQVVQGFEELAHRRLGSDLLGLILNHIQDGLAVVISDAGSIMC